MKEPITFSAPVALVKTMTDGGIRVRFDIPEIDLSAGMALMAMRETVLRIEVHVQEPEQ